MFFVGVDPWYIGRLAGAITAEGKRGFG